MIRSSARSTLAAILIGVAMPVWCAGQMERSMAVWVNGCSTIVVGQLEQYLAEPEALDRMVQEQARVGGGIGGNAAAAVTNTLQPRGTYVFTVLATLKGQAPTELVIRMPRLSYYDRSAGLPRIALKGKFLLMLTGDAHIGFSRGPYVVPMPLSDKIQLPAEPVDPQAAYSAVVRMLTESFADPSLRTTVAFLLRDTESKEAADTLRPFIDDPDDFLRASVLECLASNQDITAIGKIDGWRSSDGRPNNPVRQALEKYTTPVAIPQLKAVVANPGSAARLNAVRALSAFPLDDSLLPFWIETVHDPDPQGSVAYEAYSTLIRAFPDVGARVNTSDFRARREQIVKQVDSWWNHRQEKATGLP